MDIEVTDVIEEAVNTIEGIKHITSQSLEGYSQVTITFELVELLMMLPRM